MISNFIKKFCIFPKYMVNLVNIGIFQELFDVITDVLLLAVKLPLAWPSFPAHGKELTEVLSNIQDWKLEGVTRESNVPAFKLASRVTQEHRFQSYGSWGDPVWLRRILEEEQKRCYLPGNC